MAAILALALGGLRFAPWPALDGVRVALAVDVGTAAGTPGPATRFLARLERFAKGGFDGGGWRWPPLSGGMQVRSVPVMTPPMRYPVSGAILMPFGAGRDPLTGRMTQMDGILLGALAGAPVRAPTDGLVAAVRQGPPLGEEVVLQAAGRKDVQVDLLGVTAIRVRVGQAVRQGQEVGAVPAVGPHQSAHVVLEIRVGGIAVDPLSPLFLGPPL